jgi:hypothetical protein
MTDVDQGIYAKNFDKIFQWFHDNVHADPDEFEYHINNLDRSYLKLVDIVRKSTGGLYFRVILKATHDDVEHAVKPQKNYKDLAHFFNTKTKHTPTRITGTQVCYVQLNKDNEPIHGVLYTYSPHDENYYEFKLIKHK